MKTKKINIWEGELSILIDDIVREIDNKEFEKSQDKFQEICDFISSLLDKQRAEVLEEVEKEIKNHLKKEAVCSKKCLIDNVINKLK